MAKWQRGTVPMPPNHGWKAKPGCQIFVADRGAVRFDFPHNWVATPQTSSIKLTDLTPPDDNCTIECSVIYLPPGDFSGLPVSTLLRGLMEQDERKTTTWRGDLVEEQHGDLQIAWYGSRWLDGADRREACNCTALARRRNVQTLITFDYWLDDAKRFARVWPDLIETLRVAEPVPSVPPGLRGARKPGGGPSRRYRA